uniref:Uncharacterized protein n=1 Tax=Knipowitschia caucasica TaxID=637954 RepID=A0AAV2M6S0_KNICA
MPHWKNRLFGSKQKNNVQLRIVDVLQLMRSAASWRRRRAGSRVCRSRVCWYSVCGCVLVPSLSPGRCCGMLSVMEREEDCDADTLLVPHLTT